MLEPDAPVVFVNGVPASLQDQCAARINEDAIRCARWVLDEESQQSQQSQRRRDRDQDLRDLRDMSSPQGQRTDARDKPEPSLDKQNTTFLKIQFYRIISIIDVMFLVKSLRTLATFCAFSFFVV